MEAIKCSIRVPLYEVDMGGGVYHGNYFHFFELGREAFFREIGYSYSTIINLGYHLTVAETTVTYHKSLKYDNQIEVNTELAAVREHSIHLYQEIIRDNHICTEARFSLVLVNSEGKAIELPKEFKERLSIKMNNIS